MIKKTLESENIDLARIHILPVPDIYRNALWVKHVETITPPFNVVYANEPVTVRLFKESSYEVRGPEFYKRTLYSGEEIRNRILDKKDWESLVPKGTAEVIKDIDGVGRLLEIIKSDKKETSYQEMANSI
jgi:nicotinamide-nucleotide adenylyltransferase